MTVIRDCQTYRYKMICDQCKTRFDSIGHDDRESMLRSARLEGWRLNEEHIGREVHICAECRVDKEEPS